MSYGLRSVVEVEEEAGDVGDEYAGGAQEFAVGDEVGEQNLAHDVGGSAGYKFLRDGSEGDGAEELLVGVAEIDFQHDVGGVGGEVEVVHLLVFVAVAVSPGHDIAEDGGGRREAAGAFAEHELAVVALAAYYDAVIFVIDAVDIFRRTYELRHDEHGEAVVGHFDHLGHKLDFHPLLAGIADVEVGDGGYSVGEDLFGGHIDSEGVDGDYDELEEGVVAFDVKRRIAFGESEFLGAAQCVGIVLVMVEDAREDVVRRSVEDAFHFEQQVVVIILLEVADDGYGAAGGSVVEEGGVISALHLDQFGEMARYHGFVAGNDGDSAAEGAGHYAVGGFGVIDHLHHEIYFRIEQNVIGIVGQQSRIDHEIAGLVDVADADTFDFGVGVGRAAYYAVDALADDTESEKAYLDGIHRNLARISLSL